MSHTTQYIGLTRHARSFVGGLRCVDDPTNYTYGMSDEDVVYLGTWRDANTGEVYREFEQVSPWSSGPMIFTCLIDSQGRKSFEWVEDTIEYAVDGSKVDYENGRYLVDLGGKVSNQLNMIAEMAYKDALKLVLCEHEKYVITNGKEGHRLVLTNKNLIDADLSHANLTHSNLSNVKLFHANLYHAFLPHVNLSYAVLSNANLSGVDLSNANLSSVKFTEDFSNLSKDND